MCMNALYAHHTGTRTSLFPVKAHPRKISASFFPVKRKFKLGLFFSFVRVLFFLFFPMANPNILIFLLLFYFTFFLNWVIRIILGFFFPAE